MPVSKKRKKEGKPVHRQAPATEKEEGAAEHPEGSRPGHPEMRAGKPKNPFVARQPQARGSQRGR